MDDKIEYLFKAGNRINYRNQDRENWGNHEFLDKLGRNVRGEIISDIAIGQKRASIKVQLGNFFNNRNYVIIRVNTDLLE